MSGNYERLHDHILELSVAKDFLSAKKEWRLNGISYNDELDECPCGQQIKELCHLENTNNKNKTYVGNVCVKQFLGIDTGNAFAGLRRIIKDINANPNEDLIINSYELGYIYENEYKFLIDIKNKRIFSQKQIDWKQKINRRIINKIVVKH